MDYTLVAIVIAIAALAYFLLNRSSKPLLDPNNFAQFRLTSKQDVSHNTRRFRFALPNTNVGLGLPVGKHIKIQATINGKSVSRSYTPVSSNDDKGYFELVVKVYQPGLMSEHLDSLKIGEHIDVRGPQGKLEYMGAGKYMYKKRGVGTVCHTFKHIAMVAGGTGITPMYQIAMESLKDMEDKTQITMIFANVSEDDILIREELDELAEKHSQFNLIYCLDQAPPNWQGEEGYVTTDMMERHLPSASPDTLLMVCGPEPMMKALNKNAKELKFQSRNVFLFE